MIKFLILNTLSLSFSFFAHSQDNPQTIYNEGVRILQVDFVQDQFVFTYDKKILFSIPEIEMNNFIQVAEDLENYDVRMGKSAYAAKIFSSILIGFGTGGISFGGAIITFAARLTVSSAPFFLPEPKKDQKVARIAHIDMPYFSNPQQYSRWELPKKELNELVEGLNKVCREYSTRLNDLNTYRMRLKQMNEAELSCGNKNNPEITLNRVRRASVKFNVTEAEQEGQTQWYDISLLPLEDDFSYSSDFGILLDKETLVAKVQLHQERGSILSAKIIRYGRPESIDNFKLNELLATVGVRTWRVNAHYIAPRTKKVRAVYDWAMALSECIQRAN